MLKKEGHMNRIIFLDVDGILTYAGYKDKETTGIDIEKVELLREICVSTGAKVVISSSWRGTKKCVPECYFTLLHILAENYIEVLGDTPHIYAEFEGDIPELISLTTEEDLPNLKMKHGTGRATEVEAWLNTHDVESFVILDDTDYDWADYGFDRSWVQPSWFEGGLQSSHVKKSIEILGREKDKDVSYI